MNPMAYGGRKTNLIRLLTYINILPNLLKSLILLLSNYKVLIIVFGKLFYHSNIFPIIHLFT